MPSIHQQRLMIVAMPLGMLLLWLGLIARGDGRLDALGNPVGSDFAMFYIAGNMASQGQWNLLYDEPEQQRRLIAMFPGLTPDTYLPYRYPPLLAMLLAPLGAMPYRTAQGIWCLASLAAWLISWAALSRTYLKNCSPLAGTCCIGLVASPIAAQSLIDGQASFWWFAVLCCTWLAIQRERYTLAGMCLSLAACKPNVLLLLGIVLVVRYPRMLLGIIPMGLLMFLATISIAGVDSLLAYVELGRQLATDTWSVETPYWKVQSLLSWSQLVVGSMARSMNLVIGLSLAWMLGYWWRNADRSVVAKRDRDWHALIALSLALLINALFNPYTPVYDLMLLGLGMLAWLVHAEREGELHRWIERREIKLVIVCLWAGPIVSQCLSHQLACPQQWMPLLLLILAVQVLVATRCQVESKDDVNRCVHRLTTGGYENHSLPGGGIEG